MYEAEQSTTTYNPAPHFPAGKNQARLAEVHISLSSAATNILHSGLTILDSVRYTFRNHEHPTRTDRR